MPNSAAIGQPVLEIHSPNNSHRSVPVTGLPFLIGRGAGAGNHLQFSEAHISRNAAAIIFNDGYILEDRGQRGGLFLNGAKITNHALQDGDVISFGPEGGYKIIFRAEQPEQSVLHLLTQIDSITHTETSSGNLGKLNLLLQATMLLHSQLPLDAVLATMVDHAIAVTEADRGLLLESDPAGQLRSRLARARDASPIALDDFSPSQTVLRFALDRRTSVITEDLHEADNSLRAAESVVAQQLRAIVVIPLYAAAQSASSVPEAASASRGQLLGVLYLDSRRRAAFSTLDRQILDAIAAEAASILHNARLVERERERQRLEQELSIAREIQQALLPSGLRDFPHLAVSGANSPCLEVGGDYFDVFALGDGRTAFLIADVSGKGLGAALLTTMLQGALSGINMGADPASVFNHINRFLCDHSDVGRYATVFFGLLDRAGHLQFINAGHPSPLLLRAGEILEPFSDGCLPVGLIPGTQYTASSTQLEPGDVLVMFSDGVTEASNTEEDMFGITRLREALHGHHAAPLEDLHQTILASLNSFAAGAKQNDDITVLIARYLAHA